MPEPTSQNNAHWVLGIWDGHDSGVAFLKDGIIKFALNEERLTRKKLDVGFPSASLAYGLNLLHLKGADIQAICYCTSDFAKTLTRLLPSLKNEYYQIRRRKKSPGPFTAIKKSFKYRLTEIKPNWATRTLSDVLFKKELKAFSLDQVPLFCFKHHEAHAYGAALTVPSHFWKDGFLSFSIDGIGDGLSGTVSLFKENNVELLATLDGKSSLGIFFEHVTNLLGMRELEDEGKVMALSDFAHPLPDQENPFIPWFQVSEKGIKALYSSSTLHKKLKDILWRLPPEQFANCAQRTLEVIILKWVTLWLKKTGLKNIALSGGVASNIKVNQLLKNLDQISDIWVFPHMGDGGLALGAALRYQAMNSPDHLPRFPLKNAYLGPKFSEEVIERALKKQGLPYTRSENLIEMVSKIIAEGQILFWFQGETEYGPRSLGHRSILARADSLKIKNDLNLKLKKRVYYQPFCPTLLESEAKAAFLDFKGTPNAFMTVGYQVREEFLKKLEGVINVDGSCRPQILNDEGKNGEDPLYLELLKKIKEKVGVGALLNTSLNLHGEPMVNSPEDAIKAFLETDVSTLVIGPFIAQKDQKMLN